MAVQRASGVAAAVAEVAAAEGRPLPSRRPQPPLACCHGLLGPLLLTRPLLSHNTNQNSFPDLTLQQNPHALPQVPAQLPTLCVPPCSSLWVPSWCWPLARPPRSAP